METAQHKRELKENCDGHSVWLSDRAVIIAIVTIETLIVLFEVLGILYAWAKFS